MDTLLQAVDTILLEVGPGCTPTMLVPKHGAHAVVPSLQNPPEASADTRALANTVGRLWCEGVAVDWAAYAKSRGGRRIPLPTYPFERRRYYLEAPRSVSGDLAPLSPTAGEAVSHDDAQSSAPNHPTVTPHNWHLPRSWRRRSPPSSRQTLRLGPASSPESFLGIVYRQSSPKYAEISDSTLTASLRGGGRFNPRGEFGAVYVSLEPETAMAELRRQATQRDIHVENLLPRTLFAANVQLQRVLNLDSDVVRKEWSLTTEALRSSNWEPCQRVARRARNEGYEAIRFPSATGSGGNLAIFLDRLLPGSFVRINESEFLQ
jgi:RES domain-containing protein